MKTTNLIKEFTLNVTIKSLDDFLKTLSPNQVYTLNITPNSIRFLECNTKQLQDTETISISKSQLWEHLLFSHTKTLDFTLYKEVDILQQFIQRSRLTI